MLPSTQQALPWTQGTALQLPGDRPWFPATGKLPQRLIISSLGVLLLSALELPRLDEVRASLWTPSLGPSIHPAIYGF